MHSSFTVFQILGRFDFRLLFQNLELLNLVLKTFRVVLQPRQFSLCLKYFRFRFCVLGRAFLVVRVVSRLGFVFEMPDLLLHLLELFPKRFALLHVLVYFVVGVGSLPS